MRFVIIMTRWLLALCLPLLLLSASIAGVVNSRWFYQYGFNKYEVTRTTGLADVELEKAATGLISYFNSIDDEISLTVIKDGQPFELFNQREVSHLKDVKGLIRLDYNLLAGTLIYALTFSGLCLFWREGKYRQQLGRGLIWGGGLTLALIVAAGVAVLIDFSWVFLQFHLLSFANDLWLLDPSRDYLIRLFPQGFFSDAALLIIGATALAALILGTLGFAHLRAARKRTVL